MTANDVLHTSSITGREASAARSGRARSTSGRSARIRAVFKRGEPPKPDPRRSRSRQPPPPRSRSRRSQIRPSKPDHPSRPCGPPSTTTKPVPLTARIVRVEAGTRRPYRVRTWIQVSKYANARFLIGRGRAVYGNRVVGVARGPERHGADARAPREAGKGVARDRPSRRRRTDADIEPGGEAWPLALRRGHRPRAWSTPGSWPRRAGSHVTSSRSSWRRSGSFRRWSGSCSPSGPTSSPTERRARRRRRSAVRWSTETPRSGNSSRGWISRPGATRRPSSRGAGLFWSSESRSPVSRARTSGSSGSCSTRRAGAR